MMTSVGSSISWRLSNVIGRPFVNSRPRGRIQYIIRSKSDKEGNGTSFNVVHSSFR